MTSSTVVFPLFKNTLVWPNLQYQLQS